MKLLLDTHIVLWMLSDPKRISTRARDAITEAKIAYISAVSGWEIAVKRAAGRLAAPSDLHEAARASGLEPLAITFEHGWRAGQLPREHGDPFDRMLIAQAQLLDLTLVTVDRALARYDVQILS